MIKRTHFWQKHQATPFNERQRKVLTRLLETNDFKDGISRRKYKALTKTADATAVRDLTDLVEKKILQPTGGGRSRKYLTVCILAARTKDKIPDIQFFKSLANSRST